MNSEVEVLHARFSLPTELRLVLLAVCESFVPKIAPGPDDDRRIFDFSCRQSAIVEHLEKLFDSGPESQREQLVQFLAQLTRPLTSMWQLVGLTRFAALPVARRWQLLDRWERRGGQTKSRLIRSLRQITLEYCYTELASSTTMRPSTTDRAYNNELIPATIAPGQSTIACDYLVIGSGAGGAVMAAELAETGKRVVLVERGPLNLDELSDSRHDPFGVGERFGRILTSELNVRVASARFCGGSSVLGHPFCFPPPPKLLEQWAHRFGFETALSDDFRHSIFTVRRRLGVWETDLVDWDQPDWFSEACKQLKSEPQPVPVACEHEHQCLQCDFGCQTGRRRDGRNTYLMDAQRLGVHLIPHCEVLDLEIEDGQVLSARAELQRIDEGSATSTELTIRFHHVVLCAGAIQTPTLLMRSGYRNPHLGQHLRLNPATLVAALFDRKSQVRESSFAHLPWSANRQLPSTIFHLFLQSVAVQAELAALALPFRSPLDHKRLMQQWEQMRFVQVSLSDESHGTVRLDSNRGLAIRYCLNPTDKHHLTTGICQATRLLRAAGAHTVYSPLNSSIRFSKQLADDAFDRLLLKSASGIAKTLRPLIYSQHPTGTCRMSDSPTAGVVDPDSRIYGLNNAFICDGSILPTATGFDPRFTITTVSHYLSQKIKQLTT